MIISILLIILFSQIQVGAISSFITSRNQYASGDLGLPLGLWLFACQAHIDIKRLLCRFGYSLSDSTARNALNTLTDSSLNDLKKQVRDATERGEVEWGKVSDNIQRYDKVYEHGLGKQNELKHGTACTAFRLDDCKPGAFNADDHIARIIKQERQKMTAESVLNRIDWEHNDSIRDLHFVRVLAAFSPHLNPLSSQISVRFRTALAKHRINPHKKVLQPLSTNSEQQIKNKGYQAGFFEFDEQMGIEPDKSDNLLSWNRGDGATHGALKRIQRIQVTTPNIYRSFRNAISTPETWHTKSTSLNTCASNHYGPAASPDPSSLSRSSNAANMKRPSNLKKCDFYPTSRSMNLIWEARVLDCWRIVLGCESDLLTHFDELAVNDCLPTLEDLLDQAGIIRERYASQPAYEQSLDKAEQDKASTRTKFPQGSPWTSSKDHPLETPITADPKEASPKSSDDINGPKTHKEPPGFNGDRVLGNAILFLMEFGWWVELNYAIPEGDVGRVLEILKILIFVFARSSNQNYMGYMLDLYALLEFECSPDLKEALLNNYLFNLQAEIGKFIEGDLMQEWNNRWLQEVSGRTGADFDDKFYRKTISPNVLHFLKIKENVEAAFELKRRSKAHTSPHLRDETNILLRLYREEELHTFRSHRSMGHAAINRFDRGFQRLDGGKMAEYLQRRAEYADLLQDMEKLRNGNSPDNSMDRVDSSGSNREPDPPPILKTPLSTAYEFGPSFFTR
ncbi:hypothetical protein B0H13DRAFT_1658521 [Mycena leptocephala]|nr:hypothetical protein B0H13DRAFT_1658521 [Mycena leptocephala]